MSEGPAFHEFLSTDKWRSGISRKTLEQRAQLLACIREFFKQRNVIEVDTPAISKATVTDPYLQPLSVQLTIEQQATYYLQTSPEYAMKRLLASGSGDIYQIGKAFRDAEVGRLHNPEFTMIEWYRLAFDIDAICAELSDLLSESLATETADRLTYSEAFKTYLQIDLDTTDNETLRKMLALNCPGLICHDRDDVLNALFATVIESQIGKDRPVIITHYPASQASLAQLDPAKPAYALRFEAFYRGVELANGFVELTDALEQKQRFTQDNLKRQELGLASMPIDQKLIAALEHGMPACSGVALGFDRLLMLSLGKQSIAEVMPFSIARA